MKLTTKQLVFSGLLLAMSAVLSQVPIFNSIGLDAMPAFFGAVMVNPVVGGLIGLLAHLLIAAYTGFPYSLPAHLLIGGLMFVTCYAYGYAHHRLKFALAGLVAIALNGPISLLITAYFLQFLGASFAGMAMFTALVLPLTITASVNVLLAQALISSSKVWLKHDQTV